MAASQKRVFFNTHYRVLLSQTTVDPAPTDYEVTITGSEDITAVVYEDVGLPSWAVRWEILWSNIVIDDKILGRGNFGEVRSGTCERKRAQDQGCYQDTERYETEISKLPS